MCLLTGPGSLLPSTSCAQLLAASAVLLPLCCSKPCCQALEVKCAIVLFDQMHPRWRMLTLAPGRSLWSHRQPSFQLPLDYCSPCWGYQSKCQLLITTSDFGVNSLAQNISSPCPATTVHPEAALGPSPDPLSGYIQHPTAETRALPLRILYTHTRSLIKLKQTFFDCHTILFTVLAISFRLSGNLRNA